MHGGGDPANVLYGIIASNAAVFWLWNTDYVSKDFMRRNFTLTASDLRYSRTEAPSHLKRGIDHMKRRMCMWFNLVDGGRGTSRFGG